MGKGFEEWIQQRRVFLSSVGKNESYALPQLFFAGLKKKNGGDYEPDSISMTECLA